VNERLLIIVNDANHLEDIDRADASDKLPERDSPPLEGGGWRGGRVSTICGRGVRAQF